MSALSEPLQIIAHKHVSLQIPPSYYEVVGQELINAIKEVLKEAATENIIEAWTEGYFFLAKTLMKIESEMKTSNQNLTGKCFLIRMQLLKLRLSRGGGKQKLSNNFHDTVCSKNVRLQY